MTRLASSSVKQAESPAMLQIDIPAGDDWLSREELAALTPAVLRERMIALKPLIAERARSVELNRRPDPEVWAALRKSGIFYMFVPKVFGGLEMSTLDLVEVMLPVGQACASTCWVATFSIEHNLAFAKAYPFEVQKRVFDQFPYIIAPGVQGPPGRAEKVDGGYVINAHWKWGSGVMNADWIMGSVLLIEPDGPGSPPVMRNSMIPADRVQVPDSWHMSGMAGTGSNDIIAENVFVTADFLGKSPLVQAAAGELGVHDTPLMSIPFQTLLALTTMLPAAGAARAAVEYAAERMTVRKVLGTDIRYADKDGQQARIGHALTLVRSAEVLLRDAANTMWKIGEQGTSDFSERAAIRAQVTHLLQLCKEATLSAVGMSGASAHALDCPLQRNLRDILTMCNHALYDADVVYEQQGRALLGMPTSDSLT